MGGVDLSSLDPLLHIADILAHVDPIRSLCNYLIAHGALKMSMSAIRERYPDYVPCEIEFEGATILKLLVPCNTTVCEMHMCVRKRMIGKGVALRSEEALFMFTGGKLPTSSAHLSDYDDNAPDAIVFEVQRENTFG